MLDEKTEFEDLNSTVLPWIGKTAKLMSMAIRDKFTEQGFDLTKEQFIVLKVLHEKDGVPQKNLANITERNKGSLARLINTMEKKNFVVRIPSKEDKRINLVYLTKLGKKTFQELKPVLWEQFRFFQEDLTPEEIETTIAVLEKIQKRFKHIDIHCDKI